MKTTFFCGIFLLWNLFPLSLFAGPREDLATVTPEEYKQTMDLWTALSSGTIDSRVKAAEDFVRQKDIRKINIQIGTMMQVGVNDEIFYPFTQIKDKKAISVLQDLLGSSDEGVRAAAAAVLAVMGNAEAEKKLIKALGSNIEQIGDGAALILGRIHSRAAFEPLLAAIERHRYGPPTKTDIKYLAGALKSIDEPKAVQVLIANLDTNKSNINLASVEALGYIRSPAGVEPLVSQLKKATPVQRDRVAKALGRIGDPRAVIPLAETLKAEKGNEKLFTIDALIAICTPESVQAAFTEIDNDNTLVRKRIALSFPERKCKLTESIPLLVKGLKDASPEVRGEVVVALLYQNAVEAIPALEKAGSIEEDSQIKQRIKEGVEYLRKL